MPLTLVLLLALHIQTPPMIQQPKVTVVERAPSVVPQSFFREWCGKGDFDACTKFVGYRVDLGCASNGDSWTILGSAEFTPIVLLLNPVRLKHEQLHINDVKESMERYLVDLQRQPYDTFGECEEAAFNERLVFRKRLYDFAQESTRRRDP